MELHNLAHEGNLLELFKLDTIELFVDDIVITLACRRSLFSVVQGGAHISFRRSLDQSLPWIMCVF